MSDNVKVVVCVGIEDKNGQVLYQTKQPFIREFVHLRNALKYYEQVKRILKGVFSL